MTPIRIGYNKLWGAGMLAVAALGVALYVALGSWLQLGLSAAFAIFGLLWLTRPFLVVTDDEIQAKSMMGVTIRRFPHHGLADIEVERGAIIVGGATERRRRLQLSSFMISRADMDRLARAAADARAAPATAPT